MKQMIILFSFIVVVFGCRKKEAPTQQPAQATAPKPSYHGYLTMGAINNANGYCYSKFYPQGSEWIPNFGFTYIDSLKVNGTKLVQGLDTNYYAPAMPDPYYPPRTWEVYWSAFMPPATYTDNDSVPEYKMGLTGLPSVINRSSAFSIQINGITPLTGTLTATMIIFDAASNGHSITKYLHQGNNTVSFSLAELATLNATTSGYIDLGVYRSKTVTLNGKDFLVQCGQSYTKMIQIN